MVKAKALQVCIFVMLYLKTLRNNTKNGALCQELSMFVYFTTMFNDISELIKDFFKSKKVTILPHLSYSPYLDMDSVIEVMYFKPQ